MKRDDETWQQVGALRYWNDADGLRANTSGAGKRGHSKVRISNFSQVHSPMTQGANRVTDAASLMQALQAGTKDIAVSGVIAGLSSLNISAGTKLHGADDTAELKFLQGQPGLVLGRDTSVTNLNVETDEAQISIGLAGDVSDLGTVALTDIRSVGRVHLESAQAKSARILLKNIEVKRADARMAAHRPAGFGVEVLLGGLTVLNASKDTHSRWILEAFNLSGGSKSAPLQGSGVFIFGGAYIPVDADVSTAPAPTAAGGSIQLNVLTTGEIHSNGGIPMGTGNLITGGVFVGSGVHAHEVINQGPVSTYGPNDMVLDNWGRVDHWTAKAPIVSHGASGIGFVNFGDLGSLIVEQGLITHGLGARGFNLYDGTLKSALFDSITTYGDGAIGVQLSKPFGTVTVTGDIHTHGGEGDSLVRGKVIHLKAHALSLKTGARGEKLEIAGRVLADHPDVDALDVETTPTAIESFSIGSAPVPW